ncbi:MAG: class I SAM-dependent methyltransferase [Burkholderiaceae bacterium]
MKVWLENDLLPTTHQRVFDRYYSSYKRHFPPRLQYYYSRQVREVMELVRAQPDRRVLEIGCGTGTESLWMAMNGALVRAIELSTERFEVALARKAALEAHLGRTLGCDFMNQSLLDLGDEERYDIIWMEQAFHHLEPRARVVQKIASLVEPGGYVVISEANALNPLLQAQLLWRRGFRTQKEYRDDAGRIHPYGDERVLTGHRLGRWLASQGIETVSIEHFRVFPNNHRFDHLLDIERSLPSWVLPMFTHYNYVGRKIVERAV